MRPRTARAALGLWLVYGVFINSGDLEAFNLQQMGVEAMVERRQLSVEGSATPQLQPGGDVFEHNGHLYAAKQPGQVMAGALVYAVLHALGLSYYKNYLLTAALVTFFTAALATALAAACVLRLARAWAGPQVAPFWSWLAAAAFALGSSALPYAGVAHHDAIATSSLVVAFALVWRLSGSSEREGAAPAEPCPNAPEGSAGASPSQKQRPARGGRAAAWLAGALLGWTITTSMLPFFMVVVVGVYFLIQRCWSRLPWFALGGGLGLLPLLVYNTVSFGHPFLVPNVAGQYADTFFYLDWRNFVSKLRFYSEMVTLYVPILWCGVLGLACFPARLRREQIVLAALLAVLAGYVCNIETLAGCQYGPRYLLPAMPFAALGLIGFGTLRSPIARRVAAASVGAVALWSMVVNTVGALYGTMFCDLRRYAFAHYLDAIGHGVFRTFPLALWLVVPLGLWLVWVAGERRVGAGG